MANNGLGRAQRPWLGFAAFAAFAGLWSAMFSIVLLNLVRFSIGSELESYIPLIPFISAYLLYIQSGGMVLSVSETNRRWVAVMLWMVSAGLLVAQGVLVSGGRSEGIASALVLPVLSYITGILGGAVFFLGMSAYRDSLFPWLFLYFMVPIPEPVAHGLRLALQQGSAEVAYAMFRLTGTTVFRDGLSFYLPGLTIQVAEECSGIHSTLVLVITSLVAGHLFLRKTWSRSLLALMVIPLGLVRNGFRIVSISLLSIHVDSRIIDSPLHHRGGPVYFVLSLGVLAGALLILRRYEKRRQN